MDLIKKVLIANRGEIAVRIIKTCRRMGIYTVAVYSEADRNSMAVSMADEVFYLGSPIAKESYLNVEKIIQAIKQTGANAVHPGYGFLSEKDHFAQAVESAGAFWIGPNPKAIESMGDKINSKILAAKAGVNTIPGFTEVIKDTKHAVEVAKKIGFPVILKASAGGGGKGIRVAYNEADVEFMFPSVTNEGEKNFGDGRIFIEKYIENPRHIEIQVIADKHGNVVCLGERECSIQRNHQKVIEEAPSAFMDEETRNKMYTQVKALCKLVGYDSAGTVEFVMDKNKNFYFLEMNTRLQVEHTVTEYITGLDLVELMIRSAAGQPLPFTQEDINLKGHAIEVRICAEEPSKGFLPSVGWLNTYVEPEKGANVRIDSGVKEGSAISPYYDSMIAKLIIYGQNRQEAIDQMLNSLSEFVIEGVDNNILFIENILRNPQYQQNDVSVNFIKQQYPDGFKLQQVTDNYLVEFILAATFLRRKNLKPLEALPTRLNKMYFPPDISVIVVNQDSASPKDSFFRFNLEQKSNAGDILDLIYQGKSYIIKEIKPKSPKVLKLSINDSIYSFRVNFDGPRLTLSRCGFVFSCFVFSNNTANAFEFCKNNISGVNILSELESPISGLITAIHVKEGDVVRPNQPILTIEAMKMENAISVEFQTKIKKIDCKIGDSVSMGDLLIQLDNDVK